MRFILFFNTSFKDDYRIGILAALVMHMHLFTPIIVAVGHITQVQTMGYVPAMLGAIFLVFQKKILVRCRAIAFVCISLIGMNHLQITYYFLVGCRFCIYCVFIHWIKNKEYKHIVITCCVLALPRLLELQPIGLRACYYL